MKSHTLQAWLHATALVFALLALGSALTIGHFGSHVPPDESDGQDPAHQVSLDPKLAAERALPAEPEAIPIDLLAVGSRKISPARRALLEFRSVPVEASPATEPADSVDDPNAFDSELHAPNIYDLGQVATPIQALPPPSPFSLPNSSTHPQWLNGDGFIVGWDGTNCLTAGQLDDHLEFSRSLANLPTLASRTPTGVTPVAYLETTKESNRYEDSDLWESDQDSSNPSGGGGSDGKQPSPIGVPPPRPQPQFLRDTSVLLDPGEYQFEYGVSYTTNLQTTAIGVNVNDNTVVTSVRTLTRTATLPMEFRVGCRNDTQAFMSLPIGYNLQQISIANTADSNDGIGIGDLSFGCTRVLRKPQPERFTILGNISASAPTGLAQLSNIQQVPGVALGSGYWSLTGGMVFIRTIDPIAAYVGVNVTQTFESTLSNLELNPGNIFSYRFGLGYAINSRVSISSSFNGAYISELEVGGRLIPGSAREPLTVRLAATILSRGPSLVGSAKGRRRTTEPFIAMGITDAAPDTNFGIRWTY
jgi:hypothetical protein